MKKLISIVILITLLLSCCACDNSKATGDQSGQATLDPMSPEAMYGHIDQTVPENGVYRIWNAEGIKNMAGHPDADFELLCNVDMGGAELAPIGSTANPFTGYFNGGNFTVSNFTIAGGADGAFGFIGVNQGTVEKVYMTDVSFKVDPRCANIGTLVGINEGTVKRSTITGNAIELTQLAEGANIGSIVGKNLGTVQIVDSQVDLICTANVQANIGGIAGAAEGGTVEYCESRGILKITGSQANAGLYAGRAKGLVFTGCVFLGAENSVDGKLFVNFAGTEEDTTYPDCLLRDNDIEPMPENVQYVRDLVVKQMYDMATIEWHVTEDLVHNCKCGTSNTCDGTYQVGWTYYGLPYKHGNGSLYSMQYVIGDDGYLDDWVYDMPTRNGYDTYIGAMCSSASQMAWWRVSNSVDHMQCLYMLPEFPEYGCIPVGTGWYGEELNLKHNDRYDTVTYINACSEQTYYEALAEARHGDCLVQGLEIGDHVIMVQEDPVVVRDASGNIDAAKSYIITNECSGYVVDTDLKTYTSFKRDRVRAFGTLRTDNFVPITIEELQTGEMEPGECTILDGADGKLGMTVGTVKGNYFLEGVTMVITDSKGNEVMNKVMFPKAGKFNRGNTRVTSLSYIDYFDLAQFAVVLQDVMFVPGETYTYTISAHLACDEDFVLKTDSFTQGAAD